MFVKPLRGGTLFKLSGEQERKMGGYSHIQEKKINYV